MSFYRNKQIVTRRKTGPRGKISKEPEAYKEVFYIKAKQMGKYVTAYVHLGDVIFPQTMIGKRIRIKVECIE